MADEIEMLNVSNVASPEGIRDELGLVDPENLQTVAVKDPELEREAQEFASTLQLACTGDSDARRRLQLSVDNLGADARKKAKWLNGVLGEPIRMHAVKGEDTDSITDDLNNLGESLREMAPERFSTGTGWLSRLLYRLPGFKTPLKKYCSVYQNARVLIESTLRSLLDGKEQLQRDNAVLSGDQKRLRELTRELEKDIRLGQAFDRKLSGELDWDLAMDETTRGYLQEDLLFPLRQRLLGLQHQLTVSQQGIVAIEIIVRNNKELGRAIEHAQNVAASALRTAAAVAMAIKQQKNLSKALTGLNETSADLVAGTTRVLQSQGAPAQKQRTAAGLDVAGLGKASEDIRAALDDITKYRAESSAHLADVLDSLDKMMADTRNSSL